MDFKTALQEFGKALVNLKRAYAEEHQQNSSYLQIFITDDNYVTITSTNYTGSVLDYYRDWINTDI